MSSNQFDPTGLLGTGARFYPESWWDPDLKIPAAGGVSNDITAVGSLSITGAADLDATGALLAAGTLSITGVADLDATGKLEAAGSLSITGAADLDAVGNLLAAGSVSITGAADLDATGSLLAAGSLVINGAADLTEAATEDISATGTLSITGAADLDATGTLAAAGTVSITGAADLDATGNLLAAGSLAINGAADLTAASAADISATGSLSITGSAQLTAFGALIAHGTIVITGTAELDQPTAPGGPSGVVPGLGGGGTGLGRYRSRLDRKLRKILDDVAAEVMYRDVIKTADAPAAANIVESYAEDRQKAIPVVVDWVALEADAVRIGQLVALWAKLQRRKQQDIDEDNWFMMGD